MELYNDWTFKYKGNMQEYFSLLIENNEKAK